MEYVYGKSVTPDITHDVHTQPLSSRKYLGKETYETERQDNHHKVAPRHRVFGQQQHKGNQSIIRRPAEIMKTAAELPDAGSHEKAECKPYGHQMKKP